MDNIQATMTETPQAVSIPTIMAIVNGINHSDQCLHADTKIAEYISLIPSIQFHNQEEKNNYSSELFTIQEEVRSKYNTLKYEELRLENEKYKDLVNSRGLPDATKPQQFQIQSRRKKSTPIKNVICKRQKITETTECTNKFSDLIIEEPPEQIEIDEDEDVTPPPAKKPYAPPITIDNFEYHGHFPTAKRPRMPRDVRSSEKIHRDLQICCISSLFPTTTHQKKFLITPSDNRWRSKGNKSSNPREFLTNQLETSNYLPTLSPRRENFYCTGR
ncbi:hypothetical protein NPIL_518471 [Nephila pilipes]|uniref:Uncharacterized protein n=1 Tax=Nephila pilipes TaxID=299642 RepID=A0A8X6NL67_NEPPI|nr:hypothetical protein NPIL_518471 [Nephila pilipes]